jgi:hypothetical protein
VGKVQGQTEELKRKVEQMEKIELRRFNKEQVHERRLLLRDIFIIP